MRLLDLVAQDFEPGRTYTADGRWGHVGHAVTAAIATGRRRPPQGALGDAHSPVGAALIRHGWVFPPLAVVTLVVELSGPLALLRPRLRLAWAASAWLFQFGVLALMAIVFPYQLTGVAFAPFLPLERPARRLRAWRR